MAASSVRAVRIQDLKPGMKVERINRDLDFVYLEVKGVEPVKVDGRTKSYRVTLVDYRPGTHQDTCYRPFIVRPTQRVGVADE